MQKKLRQYFSVFVLQVLTQDILEPSAHKLLLLHVSFTTMSESALLDIAASPSLIAAPQVIKYSYSAKKQLMCPLEPLEPHFTDKSTVISH